MRRILVFFTAAAGLFAASPEMDRATQLYERTDYAASVEILQGIAPHTAEVDNLLGRNYLKMGEFTKATEYFQKAVNGDPRNSDYYLWLGRGWGRRAETSSPFTAPMSAAKARQFFERAVELDPKNLEAMSDLFDYYLQAPGFLGGGLDKAADLARRISALNAAEGHYSEAQLADKRKEFDTAEEQLRRAAELAPRQVGRMIDLARYLSKLGRVQESEAVFARADKIAPNSPRVLFWRAEAYVRANRNLLQAQALLHRYLRSNLTPEDPPREEAEKLLKKAIGA